jgi:hypothetical protein
MSEYFADKDDQSFDMPNEDPSSPGGADVTPPQPAEPDASGFGGNQASPAGQQDVVYFGILAVIIAVMIYILYSMFFSGGAAQPEKIEPVQVEAPAQNQPPAPAMEDAMASQPAPATPAPKPAPAPQADMQMNNSKADATTAVHSKKIDEIMEENSVLSAAVRKLTDYKEKNDNRISDLESEVDTLVAHQESTAKQIAAIKKQMEEAAHPKKPKKKMTYRIQAVVEGRAWIQSSAGSNMTVKVGDEVKDYGTITKIDAVNSVVETSSGRVIKVN